MRPPTVQLFINPRPSFRSGARIGALRAALEERGAQVILTDSSSDRLVVDVRADHVCAVGGDGTLRHVVDAVRRAGRPIPISTYPAGTINLLARECAYPRDPRVFARRMLDDAAQRDHYVALISDQGNTDASATQIPLLVCASVGPDSRAVAILSPRAKRVIGRAAYLLAFLKVLMRWPRETIALLHDGERIECEAVYVAKGRFFGGPWSFAPDARVGDPLLHVIALRDASRMRFLSFALAMLRGLPIERLDGVACFTCTDLTLSSPDALPLQADGDIVAHLPASIRLAADAIRFA